MRKLRRRKSDSTNTTHPHHTDTNSQISLSLTIATAIITPSSSSSSFVFLAIFFHCISVQASIRFHQSSVLPHQTTHQYGNKRPVKDREGKETGERGERGEFSLIRGTTTTERFISFLFNLYSLLLSATRLLSSICFSGQIWNGIEEESFACVRGGDELGEGGKGGIATSSSLSSS